MASHGWDKQHATYRVTPRMIAIQNAQRSDQDAAFDLKPVSNTLKEAELFDMHTNNWLLGSDPEQFVFVRNERGYRGLVVWIYKDINTNSEIRVYGPIEKATA